MREAIFNENEERIMEILGNFARVLDVEIEVVSNEGIRLFATGLFGERLNKKVREPIYEVILKDLESKIVENPRRSKLCLGCLNKSHCVKEILLGVPIYENNKKWGVIGLLGMTESQRERVLKNIGEYLETLKILGKLIEEKIFTKGKNKIYKEFFYNLGEGSLVIDENGVIEDINRSAMGMFMGLKYFQGRKLEFLRLEDNIFNLRISGVAVKVKGKTFSSEGRTMIVFERFDENNQVKLSEDFLLGKSKVMEDLRKQVIQVSRVNTPMFLRGAVGVDKRAFGDIIHNSSERRGKPFVYVNCRDVLERKLEKKIFGEHLEGSLEIGAIERARGGTLFIDEIDSMGVEIQKKLLDYLNRGRIKSRKSESEIEVNTRVIVGSNESLLTLVEEHKFLEDLYYKVAITTIVLPTLERRREDMGDIIDHLVDKYSKKFNKKIEAFEKKALDLLINHRWTGNWKEVENTIEFLVSTCESKITLDLIPAYIKNREGHLEKMKSRRIRRLAEVERDEILNALIQQGQDTESKKIIAKKLGIGMATLYRKIENYQIDKFLKNLK
ncbi:sigma 54-interacting transcriptional regulator [Cetobacterium ceti]